MHHPLHVAYVLSSYDGLSREQARQPARQPARPSICWNRPAIQISISSLGQKSYVCSKRPEVPRSPDGADQFVATFIYWASTILRSQQPCRNDNRINYPASINGDSRVILKQMPSSQAICRVASKWKIFFASEQYFLHITHHKAWTIGRNGTVLSVQLHKAQPRKLCRELHRSVDGSSDYTF